jgi:VWFA-related protein
MRLGNRRLKYLLSVFLILFLCPAAALLAQAQKPASGQKKQQPDHTIRVNVSLVQTDVMVFDKEGKFVPDLKLDQFELRIDGKVQPISFLDQVSAGSPHDEEVWAREAVNPAPAPAPPAAGGSNPGRTLLFFVDDWHLGDESVIRTRAALANLVNTSVGPHDRAAIFAASGALGSAQELVSDKAALLKILEKLSYLSPGVEDKSWPPMTEGHALLIEQNDWDVINYFLTAMTKPDPFMGGMGRGADPRLVREIRDRAAQLASLSAAIGERTLSALRGLVRASSVVPGRKTIFFLSDGFVLQPQRSNVIDRLRQVSDAAARLGIVIYSLDTRGLVVGLPDAKTKRAADPLGQLAQSGYSEVLVKQDALNALASDTGGRFLKNTNALDAALITTLTETSRYYLLAWAIEPEKLQPGKYSTIRASVKGRRDLTVRVRQGFLDLSQLAAAKKEIR